ncbi:MBL fold metallo-hydrolase [Nocardioides solisilvae]|uniref:MBL fold metallo-hydrolase n=1 Tax=Nocardioides solisilvae TaxID=1542435 RepID=UPI000D74ACDE|nr:MBL fold metallo-hydrolase [Nocardioides solisilvae]
MRVHHLNCGSMRAGRHPLVAHVLLLETDAAGLVLVDTGFGLADVADPARRLGATRHLLRPALDPQETAYRQVEALGLDPADVRHVVLTHFDLDHVGGISDFPDARVHVTAEEAQGAVHDPRGRERTRYRPAQWAHGPHLVEHPRTGEGWRGFEAARELTEIASGVVLVPMPGHSRGHAAVAVETDEGWLLHAGDAFFHRGTLDGSRVPRTLSVAEVALAWDRPQVRANHARLAELAAGGEPDLEIVCAHDPVLLERLRRGSSMP